jgi:ribosome-associated protein
MSDHAVSPFTSGKAPRRRGAAVIEIAAGGGDLAIPEEALTFTASRSGGPGGQNVNKVSSRVTLEFDVLRSPVLSDEQRGRIFARLASRINKDGILRVVSQRTRSQELNRADTVERFAELLASALRAERPRVPTRIPRPVRQKRLTEKKKRGETKKLRRGRMEDS